MNEDKFYHGGYVDTDTASKKATLNAIYGMNRNASEVIDLLTIIKQSIIEDLDNPMDTKLYHIRPESLKWVIDEAINYVKESEHYGK